jgi:predicted transcriptional regulator
MYSIAPVGHILSHLPHFLHPITVIKPSVVIHKLFMLTDIDRFWTNCAKHVINMPRTIPEMIRGDFKCEDIAKCILGIKEIDIDTYKTLVTKGPMTAESLGVLLKRERSTAYRSLQNLMGCGLVRRETRTISSGGYFFEYIALDPCRMKEMMQGNIDQWYNKMKRLVAQIDKDIMK